jgi:hypothetical protein
MAVWRRRRRAATPAPAVQPDPAEELRARLDESRAVGAEQVAPAEPPQTPSGDTDPAARRQSVHEEARARMDELKGESKDDGP